MENIEQVKTFSEPDALKTLTADKGFETILHATSSSEADLNNRMKVYSEVAENYNNLKEAYKTFSGYQEIPLLSNQYFNASMASYVRSFAGFLTIERSMDQPTALLWYNDLLGVVDNRVVLPNIGKENLNGINARFQTQATFIVGQKEYSISTNKKLIPGSVEIRFVHALEPTKSILIKDDRNGNLLAPAGVLGVNADNKISVNYQTGLITFTVGDGFTIAENDIYSVLGFEDVAGDPAFGQLTGPGNNRFKVDLKNIVLHAEPDMLVSENNLMAIAAAQKAVGFNMQDIAGQKLTELYTKLVNEKLANGIIEGSMGNSVVIPMDDYVNKFTDYNSRLDAFQAKMVDIDTAMAKRTYKATKATAYLVGEIMGNYFQKLKTTGNWTANTTSTYINDLLGYYNGVPVLRHINVDPKKGYAIHKTPGGELAPIMRGIYMPLTNTPMIGNFNNPSQFSQGIYFQEVNSVFLPELIQEFELRD